MNLKKLISGVIVASGFFCCGASQAPLHIILEDNPGICVHSFWGTINPCLHSNSWFIQGIGPDRKYECWVGDQKIKISNCFDGCFNKEIPCGGEINTIRLSPDNNIIIIFFKENVRLFDLRILDFVGDFPYSNNEFFAYFVDQIKITPNNHFITIYNGKMIQLWNIWSKTLFWEFDCGSEPRKVKFSLDSKFMVSCHGYSSEPVIFKLWNLQARTFAYEFKSDAMDALDFSQDSQIMVVGSCEPAKIKLWDLARSALLFEFDFGGAMYPR